jgi:hypothetical protein
VRGEDTTSYISNIEKYMNKIATKNSGLPLEPLWLIDDPAL